ncbi:YciI-like protein [Massilia sp. S19_KUP03_FR1]|uniref:YciI-like protein n=1 Tax=Massilia sp. S19_KUP03_FR1 TaxID=3025503 RepID=UPI003FA5E741
MHYLLTYELAPDYLERRGAFRDEHLGKAWEAQRCGELVLAGTLDEPVDQAILFFSCSSPEPVLLFAATDPYVIHGLVKSFQVRKWNTVVGAMAGNPVYPADGVVPLPDAEEEARATAPQTSFSPS